jgi:hypothetical protein
MRWKRTHEALHHSVRLWCTKRIGQGDDATSALPFFGSIDELTMDGFQNTVAAITEIPLIRAPA